MLTTQGPGACHAWGPKACLEVMASENKKMKAGQALPKKSLVVAPRPLLSMAISLQKIEAADNEVEQTSVNDGLRMEATCAHASGIV